VTGFLKLCLHTRCIQDLFKTIYNPLAFLSPSLFGESFQKEVISSESAWNETLSDDSSGIHVLLRSTGFGSCQASEKRIINTTQKQNKRNKSNEKLQRLSSFKFSFQTFFEKQKISQCTTRFNELFPRIGYKTAKSRTRSKSIQVFVIF
jgi:hypothetical protein